LIEGSFDEMMLDVPDAELFTGGRTRLSLAVSTQKLAGLVLLDEPTNHLDEQSVE
jgi:ATPase subunit of ABC transporter with duplicated ATPase domains